jgi:hypothetical protein
MLEASRNGRFAGGKVDPREAGRRGAMERERRRTERLNTTREALEREALAVAGLAVRVALGTDKVDPVQSAMMRDILDRTIGKAPRLLDADESWSERTLEIIRRLDAAEIRSRQDMRRLPRR